MNDVRVGFSRKEITAWEPEMQIWGWFMPENRIAGVATPLYARAMVVEHNEQTLAYVCMDLGFVSLAVRSVVLELLEAEHPELGLGPHSVMLTATHTHAGPCGFSDVIAQTSASYGFSPVVLTAVVEGVVEAIVEAHHRRVPATLRVASVEIPYEEKIAFNRSPRAFRRNPEARRLSQRDTAQATRRASVTLRADDTHGQLLGLINWFGVHATCVHAENTLLHSDNKGLAAVMLENKLRQQPSAHPEAVAIFAQDAAGDVSPNFRWDRQRKKTVGVSDDDHESAHHNAAIHVRYAEQAAEAARHQPPLAGAWGGRVQHANMANVEVDPAFANGQTGQRTTHATWGMLMPTGTAEGPGPMRPLLPLLRGWMRWRRLRSRLNFLPPKPEIKVPFLELGLGTRGRFLKWIPTDRGLGPVGLVDPAIRYIDSVHKEGLLGDEPWLPRNLPIQLLRLGSLTILGLPGEPTTVAGKRLREAVAAALPDAEARTGTVIVNGYSNGYAGYITTHEEYQQQEYEGSYTIFGPWTLAAYQTIACALAPIPPATSPHEPVPGQPHPVHSYTTLLQRRQAGRKRLHGPGTLPATPEPNSPYFDRIKRTLC